MENKEELQTLMDDNGFHFITKLETETTKQLTKMLRDIKVYLEENK